MDCLPIRALFRRKYSSLGAGSEVIDEKPCERQNRNLKEASCHYLASFIFTIQTLYDYDQDYPGVGFLENLSSVAQSILSSSQLKNTNFRVHLALCVGAEVVVFNDDNTKYRGTLQSVTEENGHYRLVIKNSDGIWVFNKEESIPKGEVSRLDR